MIRTDKAYLVGIHRYSFRAGEPAEIKGVKMILSDIEEFRLCYIIEFSDGTIDEVPLQDKINYKIIGFQDILAGDLPEITE